MTCHAASLPYIKSLVRAGEEARTLHRADFSIDGRHIMVGPMAPQHLKRLDALATLLKRDDLASLSSATRAKVPPNACFLVLRHRPHVTAIPSQGAPRRGCTA